MHVHGALGNHHVIAPDSGQQIAAGKRKIAIFYGAGHMSDIKKRLSDDLGLVPIRTRWLTAWDMKTKPRPPAKAKGKKPALNLP